MTEKIKTSDVVKLLESATSVAIKKFRQELLAQEEESIEIALRKYRSRVARRSWLKAQKWCKWDDGPVLTPDKVRLYYRRGDTEIVLQEYAPQLRHLKFESSLLGDTENDVNDNQHIASYTLALPYVNFLYRFKSGYMEKTMVSFCDRPLKNLKERPLKPFFSNVNNELKICHGSAFKQDDLIEGDIYQQISYCMDLFWQTVFKNELNQFWWEYRNWFRDRDQRMATLPAWQEASLENPLFVIDDVSWMEYSEQNYAVMLVRNFDQDSVDASFQQDLFNDLVDNFLDDVKDVIVKKMKNCESKSTLDLESMAREFIESLGGI